MTSKRWAPRSERPSTRIARKVNPGTAGRDDR